MQISDHYNKIIVLKVNPYHDYCGFKSILLVNQITVIGSEMCV